ncbi:hypothetical protein [Flavobacterium kingsejongi]|uniref:Uncharacterized protein n=1 Tax=Flavobacterium kingsejongi TaxID=1678728 RepID=A0A2S1LQF8_9FLAO|nr:hypothetical protein [Flavobacterium kingsejongi]AWG25990.1 hypothetical protein FK004_12540 [Flavobacterium kingsejongi]
MPNFQLSYNDRVRYTLRSKNTGSLIITEPVGWNTDEKELSRHEQYHGVIAKFSNSLKFVDSAADFIQLEYDLYGINSEIELIRDEKHPQTDIWTLTYRGYLDLSTWQREGNQVSVKFNSGGIEPLLKSRETEKIEIDRLDTMDGKPILPLETKTVELIGRSIFLKSTFEVMTPDDYASTRVQSNAGNVRAESVGVPLSLVNKSHDNVEATYVEVNGTYDNGNIGMMFFLNSNRSRTVKIDVQEMKFRFGFKENSIDLADDAEVTSYGMYIGVYSNGGTLDFKNRIPLLYFDVGPRHGHKSLASFYTRNNQMLSVPDWSGTIDLAPGDSISLELMNRTDFANNGGSNAAMETIATEISGKLSLEEDSRFDKTSTKALLAHEMCERLIAISTNQSSALFSDLLGRTDIGYSKDGKASLTGMAHGFWVRGFDKLPIPTIGPPKVENLFKPLTTSFKDFITSLDAVWNVGIGIETVGYKERIRLEELSYFYNNNVTIRLPYQVNNVKRTVATDKYYSALEIGYEQGGDYEEAMGLDEYNAKSNFTTIINRIKSTYSKLSKYRADAYGMEFARRKQKDLNNTEDTPYDDNIFLMDLKRKNGNIYSQRTWQDDFVSAPTGVFSPETATNLRFSPFNILLRHSWWYAGGFKTYITDYVRYGSSTANSNLKTKLRSDSGYNLMPTSTPGNGNEYAENGNIINSELQRARFFPEEIEFEHICDFGIMQMVEGTTTILGREIPNFYGLVEFMNEKNELEKGYLFNLKPNGKGIWTVLKANR